MCFIYGRHSRMCGSLLRPFGGGREQASGKRCRLYWCVGDGPIERPWRLVTLAVLQLWLYFSCVLLIASFSAVGMSKRRVNDDDGIGLVALYV